LLDLPVFEAWELQIAEMAGLGTAFLCVPTHFNPWVKVTGTNNVKISFCPAGCSESVSPTLAAGIALRLGLHL